MIIKINECTIEIDEAATREYYISHGIENDCDCTGCRNFREYVPCFPDKVKTFFRDIGIDDMKNIAEIIPIVTMEGGLVYYGGFFHVVGKISGGTEIIQTIPCVETIKDEYGKVIGTQKVGEKQRKHMESEKLKVDESFSVYFSDACGLLPDDFPSGALQIEIETSIPWIIEDENTY